MVGIGEVGRVQMQSVVSLLGSVINATPPWCVQTSGNESEAKDAAGGAPTEDSGWRVRLRNGITNAVSGPASGLSSQAARAQAWVQSRWPTRAKPDDDRSQALNVTEGKHALDI